MNYDTEILRYDTIDKSYTMVNEGLAPFRLRINKNFPEWITHRAVKSTRMNAQLLYVLAGAPRNNLGAQMLTLKYGGLSLVDNFWVKDSNLNLSYDKVNMYDNEWDSSTKDIALLDLKTNQIRTSSPDLFVQGSWAKAYIRESDGIYLYKVNQFTNCVRESKKEPFVSEVCKLLKLNCVYYREVNYRGELCSVCKVATNKNTSWVSALDLAEYYNLSFYELGIKVDRENFLKMLVLWGITGNIDGHGENWSVKVDNRNNIIGLSKCYDFNYCFEDEGDYYGQIKTEETLMETAKKAYLELGNWNLLSNLTTWLQKLESDDNDKLFMRDYTLRRVLEIIDGN